MLSSRPVQFGMDSQLYPSRTPARMKGRLENAVPMTVHGLGKGKATALQTPFHAGSQHAQKDAAIAQTQGKPIVVTTRPRPLGDKTPFPNRARNAEQFETPLPKLNKFPALSFLEPQTHLQPQKTPDSVLRPSTARKHVRVPRSASKSFETPLNNGNPWDVSDISIVTPDAPVQELAPENDYDEIEYMPPNTLNLAYQPPFDFHLPNYREVGTTLLRFAHSYPYDDTPVAEIEVNAEDIQRPGWDMLQLPELESDDPFHQASIPNGTAAPLPQAAQTKSRTGARIIAGSATSKAVPVSRTTPATRIPSSAAARSTKPMPSRPGTSKSTAPSTKPSFRANPVRSSAAGTTDAPISQKPRPIDMRKPAAASRTTKPPVNSANSFPSRPATSAAVRSRAASTTTTASIRRPVTATSSYRTTPAAHATLSRTVSSKLAPAGEARSGAAVKNEDAPSSETILLVDGGLELDDDFRFDV
ncbi:hypothetical protein LshimejAT787_1900770 [Lyophyllum shimeji]|uniref:Uncharacterized protein n=1 Tax=Lyophyllum shimeji TaxID=47721 RepID=A0A9P3Q0U7_LYOSH|nr:hypothetical protein LshimejAT787_1900770 [Lyophyllum shimeji]